MQIISKSKQELTNEIVNLDNHKRNLATEKGNKKNLIFNKNRNRTIRDWEKR